MLCCFGINVCGWQIKLRNTLSLFCVNFTIWLKRLDVNDIKLNLCLYVSLFLMHGHIYSADVDQIWLAESFYLKDGYGQ